jgi:hypothetical protein
MAPSAPPSTQRGEFDSFPGRREQPNQCRHKTIASGLFNKPNPQKKSQKKTSTIWPIPRLAKPTVPNSVSRKAILEQNIHQPQQHPQPWTKRMTEQINWDLIVHRNPQSNFAENNESNCAEYEFSKRETRKRLLGNKVGIVTDQTKPFNTEVAPRKVFRSNHRWSVAPSDPSLIKPSGQIQAVRPEKPKWSNTSNNPNIILNNEPKGWYDITKCPVVHWNPQ